MGTKIHVEGIEPAKRFRTVTYGFPESQPSLERGFRPVVDLDPPFSKGGFKSTKQN
jgi:hypothetical protein